MCINKFFLIIIACLCLNIFSISVFSQSVQQLPSECKTLIAPLLQKQGMTLTDLEDSTKAAAFLKTYKGTSYWQAISSACKPKILQGCSCVSDCSCVVNTTACINSTICRCASAGMFTCCFWNCVISQCTAC